MKKRPKVIRKWPIYTTREGHTLRAEYEGQYEIKIYFAPHNETETGVLNKNVATVETNNRKFPKLIAIGVNLKNLIYSYIFFFNGTACVVFSYPYHFIWLSYLEKSSQLQLWKGKAESSIEFLL